jgi:hypothetical protein
MRRYTKALGVHMSYNIIAKQTMKKETIQSMVLEMLS